MNKIRVSLIACFFTALTAASLAGESNEPQKFSFAPENAAELNSRVEWSMNVFLSVAALDDAGAERLENISTLDKCDYSEKTSAKDEAGIHFARRFHDYTHSGVDSNGKTQNKKNPVSGKTIRLLMAADGSVKAEDAAGLKESELARAIEQPDANLLLPKTPVAAGDSWNSADINLRFFAGRIKKRSAADISATMKLEKITEDNSGRIAEISVDFSIYVKDAPAAYSVRMKGTLLYDIDKKSAVSLVLNGTIDSGLRPENDPLAGCRITGTCKFEMKGSPGKADMEPAPENDKKEESK